MQQYFLENKNKSLNIGQKVELNQADSHHLLNVLRAGPGFKIVLVYQESKYLASMISSNNGTASFELLEKLPPSLSQTELPVDVTIACGLSKNDKIDQIVQKATETGMTSFQPLALNRDVVKWEGKKAAGKICRLQKISQAAAEQSKRLIVPAVHPLLNLKDFIRKYTDYEHKWIAYEEVAKEGEHRQLAESLKQVKAGDRIVIVFGSEGGLTEKEVSQLTEKGFQSCSLGPRILRAETAPVYVLSIISYKTELLDFTKKEKVNGIK